MTGNRTALTFSTLIAAFLFASSAIGEMVTEEKEVVLTDEEALDIEIDFGLGELFIDACDPDKAFRLEGDYEDERFEYDYDYRKNKREGRLYFDISAESGNWHDRDVDNEWRLGLTDRIPIEFKVDIGAASCEMRLGGLSVRRLWLDIGAADCNISFEELNGCELDRIVVDAGASSVTLEELGNARFGMLKFKGGVGSSDIDFSGKFDFDAEADISVGLGSVNIIVPEHIGVRIYAEDTFLSSIDIPKRHFEEIERDFYESRNWDDAEGHLEITLQVGMGSANIDVR
ncbi:MAG: hypothetical protein KKG33_00230 [candidate division Zixibacteria bacterium]|nr:hypothetical protein [candidate division Zixibacteria bacterium]MBU1469356.1 hypothetical protein [candidate division Zixibacteria bacterium]MBU2623965.1 hypothetical protein [candidate division Zixibacteria bacterium]